MEPIVLRAGKKGNGLFATQWYNPGDKVINELYSIIDRPLQFVNHSCDPNCDISLLQLTANRFMKQGEEITIDYDTVGFDRVREPFHCQCRSPQCRGYVDGPRVKVCSVKTSVKHGLTLVTS